MIGLWHDDSEPWLDQLKVYEMLLLLLFYNLYMKNEN
jgi:hypothetical protein